MKLGILGKGKIVQEVLPLLAELNYENIYLLTRTQSKDKAADLCATYDLNGYFTDYDEMLKSDLDAFYIALPNHLHYEFAKKALLNGKHVFLEKPAVTSSDEFRDLINIAKQNKIIFSEAMSLHFAPAYQSMKKDLSLLGDIKLVNFQFCQYSSRYDNFKKGIIAPAFDPAQAGGALMDLNVYNIHGILGLFGAPLHTTYFPNIERGVDTSGILVLDYPEFKAVTLAAKDCQSPSHSKIAGTNGCLEFTMPLNQISGYTIYDKNKAVIKNVDLSENTHRLSYEFKAFNKMVESLDYEKADSLCHTSLEVIKILERVKTRSASFDRCRGIRQGLRL